MPITEATLVVEDGTGLTSGNSYQSISGASGYHARVGNDVWFDYTADEQAAALVSGTRFVEARFRLVGQRLTSGQALHFPAVGAWDADYFLWEDVVPPAVAEAVSEYALLSIQGQVLFPPRDPAVEGAITSRSETVGPHSESFSFASPIRLDLPRYPEQDQILIRAGLVRGKRRSTIRG